ncbi:hypothetical protein NDN08_003904 [Rhodosorus marinus]|uniref:Uncharacterized protein n=1 Tax=Rhodosorus marinus TaxID=101924 RepID=A0AAV8UGS8_9RHOD|nr:hypothetical protein NDN08_003904 [Rhodosorus marinus]
MNTCNFATKITCRICSYGLRGLPFHQAGSDDLAELVEEVTIYDSECGAGRDSERLGPWDHEFVLPATRRLQNEARRIQYVWDTSRASSPDLKFDMEARSGPVVIVHMKAETQAEDDWEISRSIRGGIVGKGSVLHGFGSRVVSHFLSVRWRVNDGIKGYPL